MQRILTLAILAFASSPALAGSDVLVIDFETPTATTGFSGMPALTNEYLGDGLLFAGPIDGDGGAVLNQGGNFGVNARSGVQFLAFNDGASSQTGTPRGPERITLVDLSARSVSVWVSGGGTTTTFSLEAFAQGVSVGGPIEINVSSGTWGELQLEVAGGFDEIEIDETGNDAHWVVDDLTFELGTPLNSFCFGDGSGSICPCGNLGAAGAGCANSTGVGAILAGSGDANLANDTLVLDVVQAPANRPGLFFQGVTDVNGGAGSLFGDGLRCAGGQVTRLGIVVTDGSGAATLPHPVTSVATLTPGDSRVYQFWYRDPNHLGPCSQGFNLTNGIQLTWE